MMRICGQRGRPGQMGKRYAQKGRRLGLLIGLVMALLLVNPIASDAVTRLSGDAYDAAQRPKVQQRPTYSMWS